MTPLVGFQSRVWAQWSEQCVVRCADAAAHAHGLSPQHRSQLVVPALVVLANVGWVAEGHVHVRGPPLRARTPRTAPAATLLDADDGVAGRALAARWSRCEQTSAQKATPQWRQNASLGRRDVKSSAVISSTMHCMILCPSSVYAWGRRAGRGRPGRP